MKKLDEFVSEMTKIVERESDEKIILEKAEKLMGELVSTSSWLPDEKKTPDKSIGYGRHQLYCDPQDRFEVLAMVWEPGQKTPLHDHDGTWGIEGVLTGRLKIRNYLQMGEINENTIKLIPAGSLVITPESTGELLPPADCHILEVAGDETVITIHVYGKQLVKFLTFEPTDKENVFQKHIHYPGYTS